MALRGLARRELCERNHIGGSVVLLKATTIAAFAAVLTACNPAGSTEPVNETQLAGASEGTEEHYHPRYPLTAFNDAFETRFRWENRGQERMVSDTFRGGSVWYQSPTGVTLPASDLLRRLLPELNNGPFAENPISGCVDLLSVNQTFVEQTTFTSAAVRCADHYGVATILNEGDYIQVWLVTGREVAMTREQALDRSARLAVSLERRIWDEM